MDVETRIALVFLGLSGIGVAMALGTLAMLLDDIAVHFMGKAL